MKKYTHVKCLRNIIENDVILFEEGQTYKIVEFDFKSLLYYIEMNIDGAGLTDEFAISPNHPDFKFLVL